MFSQNLLATPVILEINELDLSHTLMQPQPAAFPHCVVYGFGSVLDIYGANKHVPLHLWLDPSSALELPTAGFIIST